MSSGYEKYHRDYVQTSVQRGLISRHNFAYINFFRFVLPTIQKINPKRILDIGAGAGTLSFYLASLGYKIVAVEISKTATEIAKESLRFLKLENNLQVFQSRLEEFKYSGPFDLVLCLEVLEHCFDDKKVLLKIHNNLRKGGILILSTPLKNAPLVKLGLVSKFDKEVGHLRRYDKNEIITKLNMAGFVVKSYIETEGIIRNSLFVFPKVGFIVKFLKSYLSDCFTVIDDLFGKMIGYSDGIVVAIKK
ncbi:methyltransferase domain-containing protein [Candidatus Collierbacteria bacterium]|nr:methyltransferase domain-containing protein [Candidatus Collierbacteria bacterium]